MSDGKEASASRHFTPSKPKYNPTVRTYLSQKGWYEPEELKTLQQLFNALWLVLRKQVFPWDVEARREELAIQLFRSIPRAGSDAEQLKQAVLSLWQIQQLDSKRSGIARHKAMGSNRLVTPIYDPQHLPAP